MKIRTTILAGFSGLLLLVGAWGLLSFLSARAEQDRARSADQLVSSLKLADQLRQSSDDLTRMARIYVSTGEATYRDYFLRILAIRSGTQPRPPEYSGLFWDQVLSGSRTIPDEGETVALRELMQRMGFTEAEFALLKEAEDNSNDLVNLEEIAMNAVVGRFQDGDGAFTRMGPPDFELARSIMFGARYHAAKEKIMEPIERFNRRIEERLRDEMDHLHQRSRQLANLQLLVALLTSMAVLAGLFNLRRYVLAPLHQLTRDANALRNRDYSTRVAILRQDEMGELGQTFNEMAKAINADIANRDQAANELRLARDGAEQARDAAEQARDAAEQAQASLEAVNREIELQNAIKSRLGALDDRLRGERDSVRIGNEVLSFLAVDLGIITGAFFVMEENGQTLRRVSVYSGRPGEIDQVIRLGEGLAGEVAKSGRRKRVTDVPPGYLTIRSGLGASEPREILILPVTVAGEVNGVIELASISAFSDDDLEFLDIAIRHIGVNLEGTRTHREISRLLRKTGEHEKDSSSLE